MSACLARLILAAAVLAALPGGLRAQETALRFQPTLTANETPDAAAECLALAITYEAGQEPVAGQEAVAQVILNRVRHPAYPDSVCGVVWQGSMRRTGCQFTFTCDGSLRRPRAAAQMTAARAVALRVLAGESTDHVVGATHYHADYVTPYWAPSLTRVRQIATHIFYRAPGALRASAARPLRVALDARPPDPTVAPSPDPAIRNGEFAPWGLSLGPVPR
ncbi:MAG: cell wall hydrolase [Porphyrobacter sp.]|jgi:spore germination cell wall hydrolase CwlJ-like protein|nr:cell wall hydrolase [Porphyrobacter sp.]